MTEFVKQINERARQAINEIAEQLPLPDEDPILFLIGILLGDGYGDVLPPDAVPISSQEWLDWHYLISRERAGTDRDDAPHTRLGGERNATGPGSDADLGRRTAANDDGRNGHDLGHLELTVAPQAVDLEEGTVFAAYRVQKAVVRGSLPHPANVVESAAMACVEPPDVTYRHHLPPEVIVEGRISNLQIEDVIYAGQATEVILPDGTSQGTLERRRYGHRQRP